MNKIATLIGAGLLMLASSAALNAAPKLSETRNVLQEWVELKKLISEERSEWEVERRSLAESIELLQTELETLEKNIAEFEEEASAAERQRRELTEEEETLKEASAVIDDAIGDLEARILEMRSRFPDPLKERVRVAVDRIPRNEEAARQISLSNRMQFVIGALTEIERFNNQITLQSAMKDIDGEQVLVNTLYVGLAVGYYVDGTLTEAGLLYPSEDGWSRESRPELAQAITNAVAVYQKEREAAFVNLPIEIK